MKKIILIIAISFVMSLLLFYINFRSKRFDNLYQIKKENEKYSLFVIYNNKYKKLLDHDKNILVDKISTDVIKVTSGAGTGINITQYYSFSSDKLSKYFYTPLCQIPTKSAYMTYENKNDY